jgi:alcohol dehydrogenase, propanol-preferring
MKAFALTKTCDLATETHPLTMIHLPFPEPGRNQICIRISCCGVCHTELDEIEGRSLPPYFPIVLGHQIVGYVEKKGEHASKFKVGDRVGVAWIFSACGHCKFCLSGQENLCAEFKATGRDAHGGYAQHVSVDEKFAYAIPEVFSDDEAAPLLCAGAIGYRSLQLSQLQNGDVLGLSGFGASGHLVLKMSKNLYPDSKVWVFARSKNEQQFALSLGANWAGSFDDRPPVDARAIIDTTPAWGPIIKSLKHLDPGGRLVVNAIRKEDADKNSLLGVRYQDHLWMEKEIKSVANITRRDVEEFLSLAAKIPIKPDIEVYPFRDANQALLDLKHKHVKGAKVIEMRSM